MTLLGRNKLTHVITYVDNSNEERDKIDGKILHEKLTHIMCTMMTSVWAV